MHVLMLPDDRLSDGLIVIGGDEAHHAQRVKRVREGERVLLLNGAGVTATGVIEATRPTLTVRVHERRQWPPTRPVVRVLAAVPKGPRLADMIDALVQSGAASWTPLLCELSVADPTPHKIERTQRIVDEACKQSRRPWRMTIGNALSVDEAVAAARANGSALVIADALGEPYRRLGAPDISVLIGPEGGFTPRELDAARSAGARLHRFGPHVMRIETAAAAAASVILHAESQDAAPAPIGMIGR